MRKGFTLIEVMIVVAIMASLGAMIGAGFFNFATPSEGTRSGIITKLSTKGIIWKTYEGSMMIGSGNSGEMWSFSIGRKFCFVKWLRVNLSRWNMSRNYLPGGRRQKQHI